MRLIAIDGPGGAGKSTVARALALRLGLSRLDTGAMYRAVALLALEQQLNLDDEGELAALAKSMCLDVDEHVMLNGRDVTQAIRSPEVDDAVSRVAGQPAVRMELVRRQREWAELHNGGVVEGRDIATVVFPDANLKIYLTADEQVRAQRRLGERLVGERVNAQDVLATRSAIQKRDERDTSRDASPLRVARDALVIDSTERTVEDVVNQIVGCL